MTRDQKIIIVLRGIRLYLEKLDNVTSEMEKYRCREDAGELVKIYNINCDIIHSLYYMLPEDTRRQLNRLPERIDP